MGFPRAVFVKWLHQVPRIYVIFGIRGLLISSQEIETLADGLGICGVWFKAAKLSDPIKSYLLFHDSIHS